MKTISISENGNPIGKFLEATAVEKEIVRLNNEIKKLTIEGVVENKDEPIHKHIVMVNPIVHHYEDDGEPEYIKYGCPVCEAVGERRRVHRVESNCPICGVRLNWT